jgi:hypothetical protein
MTKSMRQGAQGNGLVPERRKSTRVARPLAGHRATQHCHADLDGDCSWRHCPQKRDGEPNKSGRSCPLWIKDIKDGMYDDA